MIKPRTARIEGKILTKDDVGRVVIYTAHHGKKEEGLLSSFRLDVHGRPAIFVRFNSETGQRCAAEQLSWPKDESLCTQS